MKSFVVVFLLLAVSVAAGWFISRSEPVTVKLHTANTGPVSSTASNTRVGTVKACRRAYLAPSIGGQVDVLGVKEGDKVRQGQLLMSVWNKDLKARIDLARAEASASRARALQACSVSAGARREADRLLKLQKHKRIVSEESVDSSVTEAESLGAACKAARASIRVNTAQIEAAEAALERTLVKAPFDGIVAEINAELGEFVTPSPPGIPTLPAIDLLDVGCLFVSAPIDEVDAPAVKTGMQACVSLDSFPNKRCSGSVRRIAPYVQDREKQARTVEVEVELVRPEDLEGLLPGYSADIEILLSTRENTLRIPTDAILEENHVLVYEPGKPLSRRRITPGLSNWDFTEILSGLESGEQIVLSIGKDGVKAGVHAEPEATEPAD